MPAWRSQIGHKGVFKMKRIDIRSICMIIISLLLVADISSMALAGKSRETKPSQREDGRQMTQEELQAAVISYANRYIAIIGQAAFQLEEAVPTDQARLNAARRKVYSMTAIVETACRAESGHCTAGSCRDGNAEPDAWDLAAKVMTVEQRQEFRDLIGDWHANHPEQVFRRLHHIQRLWRYWNETQPEEYPKARWLAGGPYARPSNLLMRFA